MIHPSTTPQPAFEADEIELLVADYLRGAAGDVHLALRRACSDVLREMVDAQLARIELTRAASLGDPRRSPARHAA